jgi:hypothetical protein
MWGAVALRDWWYDPVLSDAGYFGSFPAVAMPIRWIQYTDSGADYSDWTLIGTTTAARMYKPDGSATAYTGLPSSSDYRSRYGVSIYLKWDSGYMWAKVSSYPDSNAIEVVYRRSFASSLSEYTQVGRVVFGVGDVYSIERNGASTSDTTGIGELGYRSFPSTDTINSDPFSGKTIDVAFGSPSITTSIDTPYDSQCSQVIHDSIEGLLAGTVSVPVTTLWYSGSPYYYAGCYSNTTTVGLAKGMSLNAYSTDSGFGGSGFPFFGGLLIKGGGSRDGWTAGSISPCDLDPRVEVSACSEDFLVNSNIDVTNAFSLVVTGDWFRVFSEDGVSAQTKRLAKWLRARPNGAAGWSRTWGIGEATISVY